MAKETAKRTRCCLSSELKRSPFHLHNPRESRSFYIFPRGLGLGGGLVSTAINQKIMNYSSYLLSKDNCSIVKQIFLISQDLHHAGKNSYYSNIIDMSEYYNLPCFDVTNLTNAKVKHFVSVMQQKYILYRQHTMQNSSKLEFFNTFKNDCTPSYYLGLTRKLNERKLVKFRIGNHKLRIETGRYDQIPRVNRLCPLCKSNQIEDESHFLIYCNKYSTLRNEFYKKKNISFRILNNYLLYKSSVNL